MDDQNRKIPNHVAIILDGNGRWAKERGLTRSQGHQAGFENMKELAKYIFSKGISYLSVYAFSTENFKRSKEEVDYLMHLFATAFKRYGKELSKNNIRVVFSGNRMDPLPKNVIAMMQEVEEKSKDNTGGTFNICINYGGQTELVEATKKIASLVLEGKLSVEEINPTMYANYFYQTLPPVDLLIRTSGENRISNYMLWQISYAELYFPHVYFPAFGKEEFDQAIVEYMRRDRRFGGIQYDQENH